MDIVLIVAAVWIALDVALVGWLSVMTSRGGATPAGEARGLSDGSRRPATTLSLPRIGETSVPVTDR